jgi:hypothetical protein
MTLFMNFVPNFMFTLYITQIIRGEGGSIVLLVMGVNLSFKSKKIE